MKKLLRNFLLLASAASLLAILALASAYFYFSSSLPRVDTLEDYSPPIITSVYSFDGRVLAEYAHERRIVVPVTSMPPHLIQAFVAAEDAHFFQHRGINFLSILRAALKNVRAGGIRQGGSTITQQVAKSLLLSPEKTFTRKFKEAILAWRMENALSKEGILYLYLNQIYLGHASYGVEAASQTYFGKPVNQLTLAECALLAGLPQAPSRYSPYRNLQRARERQRYVLGRMAKEGYITAAEAEEAALAELTLQPRSAGDDKNPAPYFSEQVRRYLEQTYGEELLYQGGLKVFTTLDIHMQRAARQAVRLNLEDYDRRHGYRGPENILTPTETEIFLAAQKSSWNQPPQEGSIVEGVVTGSDKTGLLVRFGPFQGYLGEKSTPWAGVLGLAKEGAPFRLDRNRNTVWLPPGALILVRIVKTSGEDRPLLRLEQRPDAQSCLVALDPANGQIKAMVGGYDFAESQFNRVVQGYRQPGSAFKPILYAAALDKGYTPASIILDTPIVFKERKPGGKIVTWKPQNYSQRFSGPTTLRKALTHSYNVVTIKILQDIGVNYAANYAAKLGIESPIFKDLTMALGSSALSPMELATAFSVFANGGIRITPSYIVKILDRNGQVLESTDPADFPNGPGEGQRLIEVKRERVLSPETAYLVTNLMESVVREGTGSRAKALKRPAAAKTGTTNDLKDAWFAGFVPQLVAVSWIGFDQGEPLGKGETGSRAAAPAWVAFMKEAVKDLPVRQFAVPDTIEFRPVDPTTGLLTPEDSGSLTVEAFAPGTAPSRFALDESTLRARDFFRLDMENLR
ncbi:MAG: PBP1A family penicillin-binding protein [Desulfuromonadaceae bacterium]|nr:PBP1A family penicillin-binding protein [Desulfuromonadaceae bacterium]